MNHHWRSGDRGRGLPRAILAIALTVAIVAAFGGWTTRGAAAQDAGAADATIRFVHASPDAPAVDVVVDGTPVAPGLAFGVATEYAPLPSGDHQVQIVPAGQAGAAPLLDTTVSAEEGKAYIAAVIGTSDQLEAQVQEVNIDAVDPGQARARLINAIPDADEINVSVAGGDALFEGVGFKDTTDYQNVAPGAYDLAIGLADAEEPVATVPGIQIGQGTVYDIFALGTIGAGNVTLLPLATIVSTPCSELLGIGTTEDACVRVVHASPDAPAVDVYVGGQPAVQGLQVFTATDFVNIPAGDQQFQVTATGSPVEDAVIDTTQTLEAGQAYQIIATGTLEDIEATVNEVDLTPLPPGQARLRAIHASPDAEGVDLATGEGASLAEGLEFRDATEYQTIDAGSIDIVALQAGEETEVLRTTVDAQEGMVYDAVIAGRTQDQSLQVLLLTASATPRQGEVATPVSSPVASPAAEPMVGTPVPVASPASPVAPAAETTPVPVTPVPATPEGEEGDTGGVDETAEGVVDEAGEAVDEAEQTAEAGT